MEAPDSSSLPKQGQLQFKLELVEKVNDREVSCLPTCRISFPEITKQLSFSMSEIPTVRIVCPDGEFRVHEDTLTSKCSYFKTALLDAFAEARTSDGESLEETSVQIPESTVASAQVPVPSASGSLNRIDTSRATKATGFDLHQSVGLYTPDSTTGNGQENEVSSSSLSSVESDGLEDFSWDSDFEDVEKERCKHPGPGIKTLKVANFS